ncbi:MAG: LamG-like jellyroll fold domain-containing protein [Planctomycetota bacterium]
MSKKLICLVSLALAMGVVSATRGALIGHWALDETSGTIATDSSGREHHGTYGNAPGLGVPAVFGTGMDAAGGYMEADLGDDLPIQAEERTIALWLNTAQVQSDRKFCGYGSETAGQAFTFCVENVNGEDGVRMRHWGGNMFYVGIVTGDWNHVAIRVPAGATIVNDTEVFINGENIPGYRSGGSDQPLITTASLFYVGTSIGSQAGQVFEGLFDDVLFFDHALTEEEVLAVMAGSGAEPYPFALSPSPADGALIEDTWVSLSWSPGALAVSHDVYLGDSFDDVNDGVAETFRGNQGTTTLIAGFPGFPYPDGLVPGTTYYWRVDEVNDAEPNSPWKGPVWSFSVPPKTAYNPDPADGAEFVDPSATLSWTPGYGAKLHTAYIGTDFDDVNNAASGVPSGFSGYSPGPLELEKVYYWRVDEFDAVATYKGDIWSFTTPGAAGSLQPANGATDVQINAKLAWMPATTAASHDVYFGTDKDAVRNATTASPEYKGNKAIGSEGYDPGELAWHSDYYWRVDAVYSTGAVKGLVWSFTTADFLLVDDFESYNDIDPPDPASNRIFDKWIDGFGTTNNGALVGNDLPPYAEQTIVHGGAQSMPYAYDNNLKTSEATLTLVYPRDWTAEGVMKLSLWFRGAAANSAERMFIALNGTAVVYHDDPVATRKTGWTRWVIDLQPFADQGVNLANVNTITIGLGTKNSPAAGGSGQIYFDDIRLYR